MDKLKVFSHLVYECKKGVRSAALCTLQSDCREPAIAKLETNGMAYFICPVSKQKINIFFGAKVCIDVLSNICNKPLNKLSPEEDFMLGLFWNMVSANSASGTARRTILIDVS